MKCEGCGIKMERGQPRGWRGRFHVWCGENMLLSHAKELLATHTPETVAGWDMASPISVAALMLYITKSRQENP